MKDEEFFETAEDWDYILNSNNLWEDPNGEVFTRVELEKVFTDVWDVMDYLQELETGRDKYGNEV